MYPDDKVLVAIMNSRRDWAIVQNEGWYRLPVKHAPEGAPHFDWLAFYFTRQFGDNKWAIHYYAPIAGHELVTRLDLLPDEPDHPHAHQWYYKIQVGRLEHKIPPIVAQRWRRITFIPTSGDRFDHALEISDLFEQESPAGRLYVTLKDAGLPVERHWLIREAGTSYQVDLALSTDNGWLPIFLDNETPGPSTSLRLSPEQDPTSYVQAIQQALHPSSLPPTPQRPANSTS